MSVRPGSCFGRESSNEEELQSRGLKLQTGSSTASLYTLDRWSRKYPSGRNAQELNDHNITLHVAQPAYIPVTTAWEKRKLILLLVEIFCLFLSHVSFILLQNLVESLLGIHGVGCPGKGEIISSCEKRV